MLVCSAPYATTRAPRRPHKRVAVRRPPPSYRPPRLRPRPLPPCGMGALLVISAVAAPVCERLQRLPQERANAQSRSQTGTCYSRPPVHRPSSHTHPRAVPRPHERGGCKPSFPLSGPAGCRLISRQHRRRGARLQPTRISAGPATPSATPATVPGVVVRGPDTQVCGTLARSRSSWEVTSCESLGGRS